jgi:hypothetical protein
MSKLYQCNQCARQVTDLTSFLEIASSNNSISITNNANGSNSKQISNYDDLHFCSQKCLNEYLFKPLEHRKALLVALKNEMKSEAYNRNTAYSDNAFQAVIDLVEGALNGI